MMELARAEGFYGEAENRARQAATMFKRCNLFFVIVGELVRRNESKGSFQNLCTTAYKLDNLSYPSILISLFVLRRAIG